MSPTAALTPPVAGRLGSRALILTLLLLVEALVISFAFDGASLAARQSTLTAVVRTWAPWTLRFAILFGALFAAAVYLRRIVIPEVEAGREPLVRLSWAVLHSLVLAAFVAASRMLYGSRATLPNEDAVSAIWIALAVSTGLSAGLIVLSPRHWGRLLSGLRVPLAATTVAAVGACWLGMSAARLWEPFRWLTFTLVQFVLSPVLPTLIVQPERFRIATGKFGVLIAAECSGLEGLGLLLIFGLLWTLAFHSAIGLWRCVALLAAGALVLFGLNVLRIAALVLIGHYGARDIAMAGFHSQAGWIAFSAVALGLTWAGRRVADAREVESQEDGPADPAAEPLLVPFLAMVAAGMVAGALSGGFEWLYGLRVVAAAAALWRYRAYVRALPWRRPGVEAAIAGLGAFVVWMAFERILTGGFGTGQADPPQVHSPAGWLWVAVRVTGAVVTVPIVEELAFRGYLLRRLQSGEVHTVSFRSWTIAAAAVSSVLFGLLHGSRWPAGIAAGLLYAWATVRRGNLGSAVIAHALTNALIAALVLLAGAWSLW